MTPDNFICCSCKFARKSGAKVMQCKRGFFPELALRYNKCKAYQPRAGKQNINQKSLFDDGNE